MQHAFAVADPGFPAGGRQPRRGVDSRGGYVLKILYVETKESGTGGDRAPGTPPRSANALICLLVLFLFAQSLC